jgi:hypothetical protein
MRTGLFVIGVIAALAALFYAFNAYIQIRERGFVEALDIPLAFALAVVAVVAFWRARRTA